MKSIFLKQEATKKEFSGQRKNEKPTDAAPPSSSLSTTLDKHSAPTICGEGGEELGIQFDMRFLPIFYKDDSHLSTFNKLLYSYIPD